MRCEGRGNLCEGRTGAVTVGQPGDGERDEARSAGLRGSGSNHARESVSDSVRNQISIQQEGQGNGGECTAASFFEVELVKRTHEEMDHRESEQEGDNGVGIMFEAMIESPMGMQIIESSIFDLPSPVPDKANVRSRHFGWRERGEPTPLAGENFRDPFPADPVSNGLGLTTIHDP